jgi:predicted nucleotide-binding protein (sugar kinase/HSP70/actin superfamily)
MFGGRILIVGSRVLIVRDSIVFWACFLEAIGVRFRLHPLDGIEWLEEGGQTVIDLLACACLVSISKY